MKHYDIERDMRYLKLLSQSFPTVADASTEIINLQAILNLPKGTEHFLADIHGEYEAFLHVLKNASGNIKRKVNELFGTTLRENEKRELCSLIYYPEQKLELVKQTEEDINDWYHITIHQLVAVCRDVSSKYTRSKVRKSLPEDFSYIIQELLHERTDDIDKAAYVNGIVETIISTGRADDFIIAIANVIHRLSIDSLHILGDVYDRGPGVDNLFGESLQLHEDHLLEDIYVSRPLFVPYRWAFNDAVELLLVLLLAAGLWAGRHSKFLWMVAAWVALDMFIHLGLGFGLNEVYIMTAHWAFIIPIAIGFLLKAVPEKWLFPLRSLLLFLALFLFFYNGKLIYQYIIH